MYFQSGQCPHIDDKEGWAAYKKAIFAEIGKLGGKPKKTYGVGKLRQMYSDLRAKAKAEKE